jgi:ATP-dependent helicase/nuclease subunit B
MYVKIVHIEGFACKPERLSFRAMGVREITRQDLFDSLAQGHAAGVTVVTPNRRLAQVLKADFADFQTGKGLTVWEDADILPLDAFVSRRYEDALYAEGGGALPMLLSETQSRLLWEEAIAASKWAGALLDIPQTAARAMDAWRVAQSWGLAGGLERFAVNEDTRAFAEWAGAYARRLKKGGQVDAHQLHDLDLGGKAKDPELLVAYAFDVVPARVEELLSRFHAVSCFPEKKKSTALKCSFASPREELEAAARWARARLEEGRGRIGVVVPELGLRRREVVRVFTRVMGIPAGSPSPFNLSLGEALAGYPVVAAALSLLELSLRGTPFEAASRLIRSPFLGGAQAGMAARARFDAKLREEADTTISLPKLISVSEGSLRSCLEKIFQLKSECSSPHDWARHFTAVLEAAGFPGERVPDSAEYQARAKFNELLGEVARLSLVAPKLSGPQAFARLKRLCAETLFQPESAGGEAQAPVQVLGLLESAGIGFDALWMSGLTDGQWPLRARPDPFLPVALQRKAGIPEAAAETALVLDRRLTEGWLAAADEVVFSWPRREEDRDLLPSPLIAEVVEAAVVVPAYDSYRDLIFNRRKAETYTDETAPALADSSVRGGTRVLADQAASPFRAFARHRLRARELAAPEEGLDAMERGNLLHKLMEGIWKEAKSSAALGTDLGPVISRAAAAAVEELNLEGRFAELERARLARIAGEWLDVERARAPFEVVKTEEEALRPIGPLMLKGRIDRMDRLLEGEMRGSHVLIDYKTGSGLTPQMWRGARPDEPQLPFYALTSGENVKAVAFARVRPGQMRFMGYAEDKSALPKLTHFSDWPELVAEWQASLTGLANEFASGAASVDPKNGLKTCRNCDLQTLCRVHEKLSALEGEEGGE